LALAAVLAACSGSAGSVGATACVGDCATPGRILAGVEVQRVVSQAVHEAQARNVRATIAVVDRVSQTMTRLLDGQ